MKDYLKIYLRSTSKAIVTRMSFKGIEEELQPPQFLRIHKSYIVSLSAVTSVRKNSVFLQTMEIPLSENYREAFYKAIGREG
jgi:DNA-binding LytR/AlgR family response regulator